MDWRIVGAVFSMVFVSELGDKTWLALITTSAASHTPVSVLFGGILALCCSTLLAVTLGGVLGIALPARLLRVVVGVSFLVCGLWFLLRS